MLTIGKLASEVGIGVETVRFYQRKGLIDTPRKTQGFRQYGQEVVRQLQFIKEAQKAGFTLNEIKELIALDSSQDHQRAQELASARITELDARIADLQQARDRLKNLFKACTSGGKNKPCAILKAFDV